VLPAQAADIVQGAGATFPAPLILQWAVDYRKRSGVEIRYDPVGSGVGVARASARQVDFGVTDAPLADEALRDQGLRQFPIVIGGVVPVFNVTGIASDNLRLDAKVLADIYLGRVRRWDDPRLQALNPGLHLPSANITVVHRGDASGTSFLFSRWLALYSEEWRQLPGAATLTPAWPLGTAGTGNEGVASSVQRTRMSIGYVEYAYARLNHLKTARLRNREGAYVAASRLAFQAAAAGVHWDDPGDGTRSLIDAAGAGSWPVAGASFVLVPQATAVEGDLHKNESAGARSAVAFFTWAQREGQAQALALDYVPVPAPRNAPP
jgi:phosphate transport system substrate-binding protein